MPLKLNKSTHTSPKLILNTTYANTKQQLKQAMAINATIWQIIANFQPRRRRRALQNKYATLQANNNKQQTTKLNCSESSHTNKNQSTAINCMCVLDKCLRIRGRNPVKPTQARRSQVKRGAQHQEFMPRPRLMLKRAAKLPPLKNWRRLLWELALPSWLPTTSELVGKCLL